jgi:hypothetical protein
MFQDKVIGFFYLKIFLLIVLLTVIASIVVKVGTEIFESSFTNNTFTLLYIAKDSKIIFVDKTSKSALFLAVGDIKSIVKGKSPLEASFALGVPIDAIIADTNPPQNISDFTRPSNMMRLIFSPDATVFKNLDRYDIYKLGSALRGVPKDNRHEMRVNLFDEEIMKDKVKDLFADSVISNLPITIEIDNATSIDGLGNDLAVILGRRGFNVIAVRTANRDSNSYLAYPGESNVYISSLKGLTGFPVKKTKVSQAAEITIFLGSDLEAMLSP